MTDAAFREAVEALIDGVVNSPQDESETTALRARVLALYAALGSRLLAAEARVREMEEQASRPVPLDYGRHPITDARRDFIHHALTYPGFVGNRDLFVEAARDLAAEAATLRAERDALVPLARFALFALEEAYGRESMPVSRDILNRAQQMELYDPDDLDDVLDCMPRVSTARAILAREET